jgi:cyclopropane-fatty-acyl-phospholipid synthase
VSVGAPDAVLRAAVEATNRHYDLPPEVFAVFLGSRMKYTSGLYADGVTSLDEAQEAKLRFIADSMAITGGESVLDIGVGWGSLAFFLAERHGCQVTGVTPSSRQAAYVRRRAVELGLDSSVKVLETSVYDLDGPAGQHDAVALLGVIEHLPDHRRAVAVAATSLRRGGRLYMSASCYRSAADRTEFSERAGSRHVAEDIFGYAQLRPLSELVAAIEDAGLSPARIVDLTTHYAHTIDAWLAGVRDQHDAIDALRPGIADELTRYLTTTNAGWGFTTKHYAIGAVRSRWGITEVPR